MDDHLATHTDLKQHNCDICGQTFKTKRNLRRHKESHNSGNVHCPICQKPYSRVDNLKTHLRSVHRDVTLKVIKNVNISEFIKCNFLSIFLYLSFFRIEEINIKSLNPVQFAVRLYLPIWLTI